MRTFFLVFSLIVITSCGTKDIGVNDVHSPSPSSEPPRTESKRESVAPIQEKKEPEVPKPTSVLEPIAVAPYPNMRIVGAWLSPTGK
jgi:hypothetical protein